MLFRGSELLQAKLVLLGSMGVGKTSLMRRVSEHSFDPYYEVTVAVSYRIIQRVISGREVSLQIWDTAGMERYSTLGPIYYRGADAAIFVYDLNEPESAADIRNWHKTFREAIGEAFFGAVVANKADLCPDADTAEMEQWSAERSLAFFRVSAKTGDNVELLFEMATQGAFLLRNTEVFLGREPIELKRKGRCC